MAVQHRQQHRQPVLFEAKCDPPWIGQRALIDQGLHLDQQRPGTFPGDQDATARDLLFVAREKDRRRITDLAQPLVGHRKHPQFVDRAEAILDRANQTKRTSALALEVEHGVDHVLEHARAGQRAFFRHMPHQKQRRPGLLGKAHKARSGLTHLGHRTWRGLQRLGVEGLDGIEYQYLRTVAGDQREDAFNAGLGQQPQAFARAGRGAAHAG